MKNICIYNKIVFLKTRKFTSNKKDYKKDF